MNFLKFTLLAIMMISCSQNDKSNDSNKIQLNIDPREQFLDKKNLIVKKNVSLQTIHGSLFKKINKIEFYNNYFYVLDAFGAEKLFIFNSEGLFIKGIGEKGKGPNEFQNIIDFNIDENNSCLEIWDNTLRRISKFDLNGNYIISNEIEIDASNFINFNNGYFFYLANYPILFKNKLIKNNILFYKNNSIVEEMLPMIDNAGFYHKIRSFNSFIKDPEGGIYIFQKGSLIVKELARTNSAKEFQISFGNQFLPQKKFEIMVRDLNYFNYEAPGTGLVYSVQKFYILKDYFFLSYLKGGNIYYSAINRINGSVILNTDRNSFLEIIFGVKTGEVVGYFSNCLIVEIPAVEFCISTDSLKFGANTRIKESDNSILSIVELLK